MDKAVFLDRDGVINSPVLDNLTGEHSAPYTPSDLKIFPGVIESLQELQNLNYKLFLVSNQPDYAKGKTTLENLHLVQKALDDLMKKNKIVFNEYFYCYHHPNGIVPDYTLKCECRKPGNYFLKTAQLKYNLNMNNSWMIGDRDSDIYCGQSLGTKTIQIIQKNPDGNAGKSKPDFIVNSLEEAVKIISRVSNSKGENHYAKS